MIKHSKKRGLRRMALTLALALVVVIAAVGGTLAWLTATTGSVTNTFTAGDIDIALTETFNTDTNADNVPDAWEAKMVPGNVYTKDPEVTVKAGSEKCYLFVEFEELNDAATLLTYTSTLTTGNGWTVGDGVNIPANVWWRVVETSAIDQPWNLLNPETVTVNEDVTAAQASATNLPKLVYTAYAVQFENMADAAAAWGSLS